MKGTFSGLLFLALVSGCNYNRIKDPSGPSESDPRGLTADQNGGPNLSGTIGYSDVQAAVLGPSCVSCHSNARANMGGVNLETPAAARSALERISVRALERKDMPPGRPLSARAAAVLRAWIDDGAPEQPTGLAKPGEGLDGEASFAKLKDVIFAAKCLDCHSPGTGLTDLSTAVAAREHATAIFESVIVRKSMPPEPYPTLTPKERRALLTWFDKGMPN